MQALIRALYTRLHERDPANEGVPDFHEDPQYRDGAYHDRDPQGQLIPIPVQPIRPGEHDT